MKLIFFTLIIFLGLSACTSSSNNSLSIEWNDTLLLPSIDSGKPNAGLAGAFSGMSGDYMIIAGGANFPDGLPWEGGKKMYHDEVYVYQKKDQHWQLKGIFHLKKPVGYGAAINTDDGLICLGGENADGISAEAFIIKYDAQENQILTAPFSPLPMPLTNLSALVIHNKIYIAGGELSDEASNHLFVLNKTNSGWQELEKIPEAVSNAVVINIQDKIYLIGGRCKQPDGISKLYNAVYAYDIRENKWDEMASLPYALSAGTGIEFDNDHILLFGGDKGATFHPTEILIQKIKNTQDSTEKAKLVDEKNNLQRQHPGFSNQVLMYDIKNNQWKDLSKIPFTTAVTTNAFRSGDEIIIPSGEIRAGVRTPHILIGTINPK